MFTARYVLHSTFCPHSVFMCFVWIPEQTAIISLYGIDWLVFITDRERVYCAVRSTFYVLPTQCIYVFCVNPRTNSDYFTVYHWPFGFYNRYGACLLRGTCLIFIYNSHYFVSWSVNSMGNFRSKGRLFYGTKYLPHVYCSSVPNTYCCPSLTKTGIFIQASIKFPIIAFRYNWCCGSQYTVCGQMDRRTDGHGRASGRTGVAL